MERTAPTENDSFKKIQPQHKKVLILGAGLSGIIAGKTFLDNGVDNFLVLEGQDYIGGRIKQVTTSDGEVYTADYAICTFSTGVLASDMVQFSPPLPEWKREAILKMPMSVYTKIFIKFPYKFWDDKEYILLASDKKGYFPVFQDLEKAGKFPEGSGMLLITVTDDEGRRIERQSFEKTKAEIVEMLKGVYGQDVPEPTDIFYPRWFTNPFTRGAFTASPLGTTSEDIAKIAKNLENLHFAGEGTSEDWHGYMQGAYLTGYEEARRISNIIKQQDCSKMERTIKDG